MKKKSFFSVLLLLCLSILPVTAVEEIEQEHVKTFSIEAPEGLTFSGIDLSNIDANSNTTIYMFQSQGMYTFQINSTKTYGTYFTWNITVTNPNGIVQSKELSTVALLNNNYDLHIQHYYTLWNETTIDESYDVDVYATLSPLSASFDFISPEGYRVESFYKVSTDSDSYYDIILYAVTGEELDAQQKNKLFPSVSEALSDAFSWTWDVIVSTIAKIPYIGGYLSGILILTALTLDSIIFYGNLFVVEYIETTILTFEFFVLCYAFTRKGRLWVKLKKVVDCHIRMVEFALNVGEKMIGGFTKIVSAIAQIIQALKPI